MFLRNLVVSASLLVAFMVGMGSVASADDAKDESSFRTQLAPLLRTYCYDCHGSGSEIELEKYRTAAEIKKERGVWGRAIAQIRLGTMPPEDGEPLEAATRQKLLSLLDKLVNSVDCVNNPNAGKVALRRLNRAEYRNTIRDLTGVDYQASDGFPGDDVGYGFDNIGDVLSMPPLLVEKYLDAAETITGQAIYTPPPSRVFELDQDPSKLIDAGKYSVGSGRVTLATQGTVALECEVPFTATYTLTIATSGDQGGDEPVKMKVESGRFRKLIAVRNETAEDFELSLRLIRGTRRIEMSFINDYYVPEKADRNLHIHHVNLRGVEKRAMMASDAKLPASHRKLIFVTPKGGVSADQASSDILGRFASRAFRRPATSQEVDRLVKLASKVRAESGHFEEGIQVAVQAVLVSPHFLFKVETPKKVDARGQMPLVSQYELATRISYFLWSSMPDDELLLLAHRGQLREPKRLLEKIASMLRDPRANRFVKNFAGQWLQLRNLDQVRPDAGKFDVFNDEVRELMRRETLTFFAGVMRGNLPVTTLLDGQFTYLNEPLARYYGLPGVKGPEFRRVSLRGTPRGGLLTQASILTVTSDPTRTSPVKRGKWILENLLNTPPPPAPPNVPELEKAKLTGTLRERMEQHRANPACAVCHNMMDPLGFALENYDAVGLWRDREGGEEIDASGQLPDGTKFQGVGELREMLVTERKDQFVRCLAEKLLIYAIGRGTEYYDKCAIDQIVLEMQQHDYKFAYLIAGIIKSDPFQKQGYRE
ncbi:DUF1592 domain-containing protein [bacterium]|nr:DUF1592 domain-containing protein [bacterium]MDA7874414.1 DUF1592 domain-containing protein [Rhodopirellula sp.]